MDLSALSDQTIVNVLGIVAIGALHPTAPRTKPVVVKPKAAPSKPMAFKHEDDGVILIKKQDAVHLIDVGSIPRQLNPNPLIKKMLTKYQKYQIMRWTDLVEPAVCSCHSELFLRSRVKGTLVKWISQPLANLRIIGGTGLPRNHGQNYHYDADGYAYHCNPSKNSCALQCGIVWSAYQHVPRIACHESPEEEAHGNVLQPTQRCSRATDANK